MPVIAYTAVILGMEIVVRCELPVTYEQVNDDKGKKAYKLYVGDRFLLWFIKHKGKVVCVPYSYTDVKFFLEDPGSEISTPVESGRGVRIPNETLITISQIMLNWFVWINRSGD